MKIFRIMEWNSGWWVFYSWKHLRSSWLGLWAAWPTSRCVWSLEGHRTRWPLKVPSNLNHSLTTSNQSKEYWSSPCSLGNRGNPYSESPLPFLNILIRWSAAKLWMCSGLSLWWEGAFSSWAVLTKVLSNKGTLLHNWMRFPIYWIHDPLSSLI